MIPYAEFHLISSPLQKKGRKKVFILFLSHFNSLGLLISHIHKYRILSHLGTSKLLFCIYKSQNPLAWQKFDLKIILTLNDILLINILVFNLSQVIFITFLIHFLLFKAVLRNIYVYFHRILTIL